MKIDFDKIKIISKLGMGLYGTVYLVKLDGKKYALKIQHTLPLHNKKSFDDDLWRELDIYNYINKLSDKDQKFFTKLYAYNIYKECDHIQERKGNIQDIKLIKHLKELDESEWCIKYLIEYHGKTNLDTYLTKKHLTLKQKFSIMMQFIKILMIFYKGGYIYPDIHFGNIMIKKTNDRYFMFQGNKYSYEGLQISVIDYGDILHKKYVNKEYYKNRDIYLIQGMYLFLFSILSLYNDLNRDCIKSKKTYSDRNNWYEGLKSIIKYYPEFYKKVTKKYTIIYPQFTYFTPLLKRIYKYINNKNMMNKLSYHKDYYNIMNTVIAYMIIEFSYYYPVEYSKYFGWCSVKKLDIPEDKFNKFTNAKTYKELIKACVNFIEK